METFVEGPGGVYSCWDKEIIMACAYNRSNRNLMNLINRLIITLIDKSTFCRTEKFGFRLNLKG